MKFTNDESFVRSQRSSGAYFDVGLRKYLVMVYGYMGMALGITGLIALLVYSSDALMYAIHGTPLKWVVIFSPIAITFFMSYKLDKLNSSMVMGLFVAFSCAMGMSLSYIFKIYTATSIARVFFISASLFGAMALYGNTTEKDLSGIGSFLMMGLIGLIISSLVNIFMQSSALHFAISFASVLLFTGLTAYDAQRLKAMYSASGLTESSNVLYARKLALIGATSLYFDFINIFMGLLNLFGERK